MSESSCVVFIADSTFKQPELCVGDESCVFIVLFIFVESVI